VRSNLRTLSGVSAAAEAGARLSGSCVSARSGRPRRAPRRCLGRGSAPPSTATRAARRGTARPRRFGRVIDRPCRADRVGFGAGLPAVHALLELVAVCAMAHARITVEPRDATRSVDVKRYVLGIGREAAQAASQHVDAAAQGEASRRSSSSSSAKARRAWMVGGRAPRRPSVAKD
jgi:hypothetical protein